MPSRHVYWNGREGIRRGEKKKNGGIGVKSLAEVMLDQTMKNWNFRFCHTFNLVPLNFWLETYGHASPSAGTLQFVH